MKTLDNELIGEWAESLKEIKQIYGKRITDIFQLVQKYLEKETNTKTENYLNSDYVNTIPAKSKISRRHSFRRKN